MTDDGCRLVDDRPAPTLAVGDVLVRVTLAGICSTDLAILSGYAGFRGVLGHELVGEVVAGTDADGAAWRGRRVVAEINCGCGHCPPCRTGRAAHCHARQVLGIRGRDGAFAELVAVPVANLHAVPAGVGDEEAVFTEPLAAAWRVVEQVAVGPGIAAAVFGAGRLGLLVAQVLAHHGATVTVFARREPSLELPRRLGLTARLTTGAGGQQDHRYDLVVEATGEPPGLALAIGAVRAEGTLVLKSTYPGAATVDVSRLVVDEVRVVGSRCGPFAPALAALARGDIAVRPLIDAVYPLAEAATALAHAARPGVRKVLLRPMGR